MLFRLVVQLLVCLTLISVNEAWIEEIATKPFLDECFSQKRALLNSTDSILDNFHGSCIQKYRLKLAKKFWSSLSNETSYWIEELLRMSEGEERQKRQAGFRGRGRGGGFRVRKDIRVATPREREDFFRCMNMLKEDTSISPNRFDVLAAIHQRMADGVHHGARFLAWHRILLTIIENACRQKVPSAVLLFWDSRPENEMSRPSQSVFFSEHLVGSCNGRVTDGPFSNWRSRHGDIISNCGQEGELFNHRRIRAVTSRTHLEEISEPFAIPPYDFEITHGEVHLWVGGTMGPVEQSAYHPIFYLHHAFVDCIWEEMRKNQRRNGIDPQRDYPVDYGDEAHNPREFMGFGQLRNIHGLSDMFTSRIYRCELPTTTCSRDGDCRSPFFLCNPNGYCQSKTKFQYERDTAQTTRENQPRRNNRRRSRSRTVNRRRNRRRFRGKRQVNESHILSQNDLIHKANKISERRFGISEVDAIESVCPSIDARKTIQNLFDLNGVSDSRMWVFIPVKIIYQRNQHQKPFESFLVKNGKVEQDIDMYDKKLYKTLDQSLKSVKRYNRQNCKNMDGVFTKVFVHSDGLNYIGTYKDFAIIDARQPITSSVVYIGAKSPAKGPSEVLLTTYDPCGNVCKPYCRTTSGSMKPCSGSLKITKDYLSYPNLYGEDYGSAVDMMWGIPHDGGYPRFYDRKIFIEFVCF